VRERQGGPAAGLIAQVLLLAVLAATVGLGAAGWVVGLACAGAMAAVLARALERAPRERLGPASWVTLARATLAVGVAALVADSFSGGAPVGLLVGLASVALGLDLLDGWLARRTGTASVLGARFDGEVDAFLILVLSVYAGAGFGWWVVLIGAARYVFLVGEWLVPWLRAPLPARRWRKVVTALQGVVLTVAAAGVLPTGLMTGLLAAALVALAASFGECVLWLWRRRNTDPDPAGDSDDAPDPGAGAGAGPVRVRGPVRRGLAVAVTVLAVVFVWGALVVPDQTVVFPVRAFVRLPLEILVVIAAGALLPAIPRRVLAVVAGVVLGVLVCVRVLDVGFITAFDRPFDPVSDSAYVGIGIETLRDGIGRASANIAVIAIAALLIGLLLIPALALLRVTRTAHEHRSWALGSAAALGLLWVILRVAGAPVASTGASALVVREVQSVQSGLRAHDILAREIPRDRFRNTPPDQLLTGLRGKDVLLLFVESYGRVAVQNSTFAPAVDRVLDQGTKQLNADGFSARTGYLSSSTFGGLSWLAHITTQSGIRIGTQRGYNQLAKSNRLTLAAAFKRAGWRTVSEDPANKRHWKEGTSYYHYDHIYDRRNVGYNGPAFGLPPMPDQYVLKALQHLELAKHNRKPVFAEVDLISSHAPWTKIPRLIPWNQVGDGSIYHHVPLQQSTTAKLFGDETRARDAYSTSIQYTISTITGFIRRYATTNTVIVLLGDHQPATTVSGQHATHDVPISIIARDPNITRHTTPWHWTNGLNPTPHTPVWPMETFRDRFLTAFGSTPTSH
jgi:phosphatidylglycerophosphate synthase